MEKAFGLVLLVAAILVSYFIITHINSLDTVTLPVSQKVIDYIKVESFK